MSTIEHMQFPTVTAGQTLRGSLTSSDFTRQDTTYADGFSYEGRANEVLTITMRSSDFDAWLVLDDPNGPLMNHNDDGGGGNDAQLTVTLPHDGRYIILANAVRVGATGDYTLSVTSGGSGVVAKNASAESGLSVTQIGHLKLPTISLGQAISGSLTTSDLVRDDQTYVDAFIYDGRAGERITITMRSRDFDAWLVIDDPNGPLREYNDDGGGGTDAAVTVTLPHDGSYVILANVVSPKATGSYTLTLTH